MATTTRAAGINGFVVSGRGRASEVMKGEKLADRSALAGMDLVPGTLNVAPYYEAMPVDVWGPPDFQSEDNGGHLGPLNWWRVWVFFPWIGPERYAAWVVRHENSRTRYVEVMSDTHFRRDVPVRDDSDVLLERRARTP